MSCPFSDGTGEARIPLFPLPNVVLFPGAILPLHIFEPRYRRMTADVLLRDSRVAMALLRAGWEKDYYGKAAIEPVVCVGKIVAHEKLKDGKYNYLLQGQWRAAVVAESRSGGQTPYRIGHLEALKETPTVEIDLANERQRMMDMFHRGVPPNAAVCGQFSRLLNGPMQTAAIADLAAFHFLHDAQLKQSLLAEGDVPRRVERIIKALDGIHPAAPIGVDGDVSLN